MGTGLLKRLNPIARRRVKRVEKYLELERHEWMAAIDIHRSRRDEKERAMDIALHAEGREASNWLQNREMRVSDIEQEYMRGLIAERVDLRKRFGIECPGLIAAPELSALEASMLSILTASRQARQGDYERRARAAGVQILPLDQRRAAAYGNLEALIRREVRKLDLSRSLGRMEAPHEASAMTAWLKYEPALKVLATLLALVAAGIGLYLKFA